MRERLLAPQLLKSDVWIDYARKIDQVFGAMGIDDARAKLALLRSPMDLTAVVVGDESKVVALDSIPRHERATLIKTADMLGFRFYDQQILDSEDYLRLCLFLAQYYRQDKGTERFADFMGFAANAVFEVVPTWTTDYVEFYKQGDPAIGVPVYKGGPWYPTTHVVLRYDLTKFTGVDRSSLIEFFYYFANINIVLWATELVDLSPLQLGVTGAAAIEINY